MGLLKRLLSFGSKKNKKERPPIVHNVPVPELPWAAVTTIATNEEEHEAAVGRLLRSSSARFAESSELNYATLPPLPHPINSVIQTPASSSISLASSTISRGTYNVTVHKRWRTEVPPMPEAVTTQNSQSTTNKRASLLADDSRVLRLRSDPSVASLLELYDEHGKVAADAFSNDSPARPLGPPKDGRAQVKRNGSTLRQLLGASPSLYSHDGDNSGEGDISWAERFLAESEATSSVSSLGLQTPITPKFYTEPLKADTSFITSDGDMSVGTIDNPAISSMEVEVNTTGDISQDLHDGDLNIKSPYMSPSPSTPQRASQVFEFLTRKQSTTAANLDRTLPELPSCFSSPSEENGNLNFHCNDPPPFTFSPTRISAIPTSLADNTPKPLRTRPHSIALENTPSAASNYDLDREPRSTFSDDSHDPRYESAIRVHQDPPVEILSGPQTKANNIKVIMTGPTKVIVTAPTPSAAHDNVPTRIPRGPRALPSKASSGSVKRRRSALVEVSNASPTSPATTSAADPFAISAPRRKQPMHRRASQGSVSSQTREERPTSRARTHAPSAGQHKENQLGLSVATELPATPLRTHSGRVAGSRALLHSVVEQAMFRPSPTSRSAEMSPVGRQIMSDVRQQRMHAREIERERIERERRSRSDRMQIV